MVESCRTAPGIGKPAGEKKVTHRILRRRREVALFMPSLRGVALQVARCNRASRVCRVVVTELRARDKEALRWVILTNAADACRLTAQIYVWRWRSGCTFSSGMARKLQTGNLRERRAYQRGWGLAGIWRRC